MKLKKLEKNKVKKVLLLVIFGIVFLIIGIFIDKTFSLYQVNKSFEFVNGKVNYYGHSDVYFAYYNGNTWLDDIPKKNNADNLVYDHAVCDNEAIVEWDSANWAPKVKNLTKAKTRCSLYFVNKDTAMKNCIANKKTGVECLEEVISQTNEMAYDNTSDRNLRYIGVSPNNYVTFNGESWQIIGVMNNVVKSIEESGESRIKIIRSASLGGIAWDATGYQYGLNNWTRPADLNKTLQARSEASSPLIDDALWYLGSPYLGTYDSKIFDQIERSSVTYNQQDATWIGKVGLIYPSDYGFAVGETVRDTCLKTKLSEYNTNDCYQNNWLYKTDNHWTITSSTRDRTTVCNLRYTGAIDCGASAYGTNYVFPVVYLKSSVKITGGTGSNSSPYILSL